MSTTVYYNERGNRVRKEPRGKHIAVTTMGNETSIMIADGDNILAGIAIYKACPKTQNAIAKAASKILRCAALSSDLNQIGFSRSVYYTSNGDRIGTVSAKAIKESTRLKVFNVSRRGKDIPGIAFTFNHRTKSEDSKVSFVKEASGYTTLIDTTKIKTFLTYVRDIVAAS